MEDGLSRRQALRALGAVGFGALLAACAGREPVTGVDLPTAGGPPASVAPQTTTTSDLAALLERAPRCDLTPEAIEGPFYFAPESVRSDLRGDREGAALQLAVRVEDESCEALPGAVVDIWSCDADGWYSGFEDASRGVATGPGRTDEATYLRGAQVTGADGVAQFTTLYPGWYPGRAVHVHAKVHVDERTLLTAQLYFEEDVTDVVHAAPAYRDRQGSRTRNDADAFFARESGERSTLLLAEQGSGWLGAIVLGIPA